MITELRHLRKSLFHLRNNIDIASANNIKAALLILQEEVALLIDKEMEERKPQWYGDIGKELGLYGDMKNKKSLD